MATAARIIAAIVPCALAMLAGVFALGRAMGSDAAADPVQAGSVAAVAPEGGVSASRIEARQKAVLPEAERDSEMPSETDTTGVLQHLTVDELFDEVEADHGAGSLRVDRERFKAAVRSDPELAMYFGQ